MPEQQKPVTAKTGGPFTCKPCKTHDAQAVVEGKKKRRYFGTLVQVGQTIPACPNCGATVSPA